MAYEWPKPSNPLADSIRRGRRLPEPGSRDQHKITGDCPGDDPHRAIGHGESCIHSSVANAPAAPGAMSIKAAWKLSHIWFRLRARACDPLRRRGSHPWPH
jgi:hypothetical protein